MKSTVEKSYERLKVTGREAAPAADDTFETLWARRRLLKTRHVGDGATYVGRLALVLSLTYDVERYLIAECLRRDAGASSLISDVTETLGHIRLQQVVRPRLTLEVNEVKRIVFEHYLCFDRKELINRVGAEKYFEFCANEYHYRKLILPDIPGIIMEVCKRQGLNVQ